MTGPEPYQEPVLPANIADQIIIGFDDRLRQFAPREARRRIDEVLKSLEAFGVELLHQFFVAPENQKVFFAIAIVRLDGKTLDDLQQELKKKAYAHIGWVERNASIAPAGYNDPLLSQQWALAKLGAADAWTAKPPPGNPKTLVAIVDSGLRRANGGVHADLGAVEPANICQPSGFFPHCLDRDGHGTFLAGTIAAVPGNGTGVSSPITPLWNISLLPVQFFSPAVPPNAGYAAYAIVHAALALVDPFHPFQRKVINAAWHVAPGDAGLATLRVALDIAVNLLGCLVVFAAGNDGTDNEIFPLYPAKFGSEAAFQGKVLTALATDRHDAKTFFSNYGKTTVDLGAPGLRILSTERYLVDPPRYADYSGTSPAAAYVSAGAALVFALHPPNWDSAGAPGWVARDVVQHLKASADTIEDLKLACIDGKRLNLRRAVYGPLHVTAPVLVDTPKVGVITHIRWTTDYVNPHFTQVRIEFIPTGWPAVPLGVAMIAAGSFAWTPNAALLPPLPAAGLIRITPTTGNFPADSAKFQVVA